MVGLYRYCGLMLGLPCGTGIWGFVWVGLCLFSCAGVSFGWLCSFGWCLLLLVFVALIVCCWVGGLLLLWVCAALCELVVVTLVSFLGCFADLFGCCFELFDLVCYVGWFLVGLVLKLVA